MDNKRRIQQPAQIVLEGVERNGGGELKISLKLAALLQIVMMAAGAGATYTATKAAVETDRQKIEEQSQSIRALQVTTAQASEQLAVLSSTIAYLTSEVKSMQERLWNDRRN